VLRLRPYRSYESVDGVAVADRPEHALAAGFWRCVEIIGGVGIGLALTAIPFPGE
jgi:formate-dependent nitrite reductase membrane component NrfD